MPHPQEVPDNYEGLTSFASMGTHNHGRPIPGRVYFFKGQQVDVHLLANGKPTGEWLPAKVCEVKRDHATQQVTSVRISSRHNGRARHLWTQPQYLRNQ